MCLLFAHAVQHIFVPIGTVFFFVEGETVKNRHALYPWERSEFTRKKKLIKKYTEKKQIRQKKLPLINFCLKIDRMYTRVYKYEIIIINNNRVVQCVIA